MSSPVPPPPPTPVNIAKLPDTPSKPKPPLVADSGPPGAHLVELLVFNEHPFNGHGGYWVSSRQDPELGVELHATGNVRDGFVLELKRSHDLTLRDNKPTPRIPLQWVEGRCFDEPAMLNRGHFKLDDAPVCLFEHCAMKVKAPGKKLRAVDDGDQCGTRIVQRDCQTWVVEAAAQLAEDGIIIKDVAAYLSSIKQ